MVEAVVIVICNFVLEKKTVAELIVALQVFLGPSWLTKESSGLIVALQVFSENSGPKGGESVGQFVCLEVLNLIGLLVQYSTFQCCRDLVVLCCSHMFQF